MTKPRRRVKRPYSSPLRDDQARETSQAIVDAAAALFAEKGYAAASVDAIAATAGVSRATVFTSVGGKPALLKAAYAAAFGRAAGDAGQAMPLVERPRSRSVRAEPTARGYLEAYSALATSIHHHLAGIHRALVEAAAADGEARQLMERVLAERRRGAETVVGDVCARAPLREGLDLARAADAVWALIDPTWFLLLVHDRGWSEEQFREWLAHALDSELLGGRARRR